MEKHWFRKPELWVQLPFSAPYARVAQWKEQAASIRKVEGSTPSTGANGD